MKKQQKPRTRMSPEERHAQILAAALHIASEQGLDAVTRPAVAKAADITVMWVSAKFGSIGGLKAEVLMEAGRTNMVALLQAAHDGGYAIHAAMREMLPKRRKEIVL